MVLSIHKMVNYSAPFRGGVVDQTSNVVLRWQKKKMVFDQKPHFGASKWRVVQWRKTLILMTLPKKAVFFLQKNLQKPNQKVFFLHIVIANILIEKEVVYNRRERACPSGKSKTAPAWYTRDNRGIAKRKK